MHIDFLVFGIWIRQHYNVHLVLTHDELWHLRARLHITIQNFPLTTFPGLKDPFHSWFDLPHTVWCFVMWPCLCAIIRSLILALCCGVLEVMYPLWVLLTPCLSCVMSFSNSSCDRDRLIMSRPHSHHSPSIASSQSPFLPLHAAAPRSDFLLTSPPWHSQQQQQFLHFLGQKQIEAKLIFMRRKIPVLGKVTGYLKDHGSVHHEIDLWRLPRLSLSLSLCSRHFLSCCKTANASATPTDAATSSC